MNKKQDVGDPCRTPIVALISAVPMILLVTLYIAIRANNIVAPHPKAFKTENNLKGKYCKPQ